MTGKQISTHSPQYQFLVDYCLARCGAAISIQNIINLFGMGIRAIDCTYKSIKKNLPVNLSLSDVKTFGFHSVCVVDAKDGKLKITNMGRKWKKKWYTWKQISPYIYHGSNLDWGAPRIGYFMTGLQTLAVIKTDRMPYRYNFLKSRSAVKWCKGAKKFIKEFVNYQKVKRPRIRYVKKTKIRSPSRAL